MHPGSSPRYIFKKATGHIVSTSWTQQAAVEIKSADGIIPPLIHCAALRPVAEAVARVKSPSGDPDTTQTTDDTDKSDDTME